MSRGQCGRQCGQEGLRPPEAPVDLLCWAVDLQQVGDDPQLLVVSAPGKVQRHLGTGRDTPGFTSTGSCQDDKRLSIVEIFRGASRGDPGAKRL